MTENTEQTTAAGNATPGKAPNKTLIIVIVVVLVVLALGGFVMQKVSQKVSQLAGEKVAEKMIESAAGGKADVDINSNGMTVKTDEGSFSTGTTLPSDWPKDAPVYPGSTITYSGTSNPQTGEAGFSVMSTTSDNNQKVSDYYAKELVAQGWTISSTQSMESTTVIAATKDTRQLSMAVATSEGTTTITLGVSTANQ